MNETKHFPLGFAVRTCCVLGLMGLAVIVVRAVALADDAPAPTLSEAIDTTDVAVEAESLIESNAEKVSTADEFQKGKMLVERQATVLAVLAQAVALGKQEVAWKDRALQIRDAAIELSTASSQEEAAKAQKTIEALIEGESQGMAQPLPWSEFAGLGTIMKEVTRRNTLVRRPIIRKTTFEQRKEDGARSAAVLAVLLTVARDDTHEVENKEDVSEWEQYSDEVRDGMVELANIFKEGEQPEARAKFLAISKSCKKCHDKFRPDDAF